MKIEKNQEGQESFPLTEKDRQLNLLAEALMNLTRNIQTLSFQTIHMADGEVGPHATVDIKGLGLLRHATEQLGALVAKIDEVEGIVTAQPIRKELN